MNKNQVTFESCSYLMWLASKQFFLQNSRPSRSMFGGSYKEGMMEEVAFNIRRPFSLGLVVKVRFGIWSDSVWFVNLNVCLQKLTLQRNMKKKWKEIKDRKERRSGRSGRSVEGQERGEERDGGALDWNVNGRSVEGEEGEEERDGGAMDWHGRTNPTRSSLGRMFR